MAAKERGSATESELKELGQKGLFENKLITIALCSNKLCNRMVLLVQPNPIFGDWPSNLIAGRHHAGVE